MKVAVCVTLDLHQPGGVETHILELACALRRLGISIDLFASTSGAGFKTLRQFNPRQYHIIHTHGSSLPCRLLSLSLNRTHCRRYVHTLHGVSVDYLLNCRDWLNWRCYWGTFVEGVLSRHADHIIAVSRSVETRAKHCFALPGKKITVIPNGYTPTSLPPETRTQTRSRLGLASDDIVLLFVGRGEDCVKGTAAITAAMVKLHRRYPHLRLLAVPGSGFSDTPWLCRSGPIDHRKIAACYAAADIFVNASLNEGLPLTLIEALGAGLPIVAAPVGGIPEIIIHNRNGLLLNPARSDLPRQLTRLLENPSLCRKLTQNALAAAKALTWQKIAQQTLNIYKAII